MFTRRRILAAVAVLLIAAAAYTAWQVRQVQIELERAEASVSSLRAAIDDDDSPARDRAIADFQDAAAAAHDGSDGPWWGALTYLPFVGDDVDGVRVLSRTVDRIAADGVAPLSKTFDDLDLLTTGDGIDVEVVEGLQPPVAQASAAFASAAAAINGLDSSGYVDVLGTRFADFSRQVNDAASSLASAETALTVLPDMVGADGPRDYLLIFQNNAEIRATGGLPGSWAHVRADGGQLEMLQQGTASDFPMAEDPVLPLTPEEVQIYGQEIGTYFQDPGFTPDFPRAAALWEAHWLRHFPEVELDGVLALDPIAMSYILEGTGSVTVGDLTLTPDNVVEELLSKPYLTLEPAAQDALFADAAKAIFDATTGRLASPLTFVNGLSRAAREGRFLVAAFDEEEADQLRGSTVEGAMPADDNETPYVDIGVNDTTGSKMSYYLRYWTDVKATSCSGDRQRLVATMSVNQSIRPDEAAQLPPSVTGRGVYGTEPGNQLVSVRVYGPVGGTIEDIRFDGTAIHSEPPVVIDGRPAVTLIVSLTSRDDVVITWSMLSGVGQTGDTQLAMTPSVVPGSKNETFDSACRND